MSRAIQAIGVALFFVCTVFHTPAYPGDVPSSSDTLAQGKRVYEKSCKWCHGLKGDGDGPAAFFHEPYSGPRARDFTIANYRFRSTPSGYLPTAQDVFQTITDGIPGYMPSFSGLTTAERWSVIQYLVTFHPEEVEGGATPIMMRDTSIPSSPRSIEQGRSLYFKFDCHSCHGLDGRGRGDVSRAGDLLNDEDLPILPNDLTNRVAFKNGASPRDIVRTLLTGLNGTPMPSYASQFESQPDDAWHVANFLLSLSASK